MKLSGGKLLALVLCACLLVVSLLSATVFALHGDHCDGEGCELCACLELSRASLGLAALLLVRGFGADLRLLRHGSPWSLWGGAACFATPVSLRVRMNH